MDPATKSANMPAEKVLLNSVEVGILFGVTSQCVWRWMKAGIGPPSIKIGGVRRYRMEDIQAYLMKNTKIENWEGASEEDLETCLANMKAGNNGDSDNSGDSGNSVYPKPADFKATPIAT